MKNDATSRFPQKTAKAAFTLVEMMTVVVIIGLLLSIAVPSITKIRQNILRSQSLGTCRLLAGGCDHYKQEIGVYPPSSVATYTAGATTYRMEGRHMLVECLTGYLPDTMDLADVNGFGFRNEPKGTIFGPFNGAENVKTKGAIGSLSFVDSFGNEFFYFRYEKRGSQPTDPTQFWKDDNAATEGLNKPFPGDNRTPDKVLEDYIKSGGTYFVTTYAIMSAGPDRSFKGFSSDPTTDDVTNFLPE